MINKLLFMGTPDFAATVLSSLKAASLLPALIVTQPDRPQGRKMELVESPVKIFAQKENITVWQPEKVSSEDFLTKLFDFAPDLLLTASYGQILPQKLLDIPRYGCLNIHPSLLPAYRGAAPVQAAIIAGEEITGVSLMVMEAGMDSGPVLAQIKYPIAENIDAGSLLLELAQLGAKLFIDSLPAYLAGELKAYRQDDSLASYAPRLERESGRIDWALSAREVHNLIRGTQPWPGAFTTFLGKRLKILSSTLVDDSCQNFAPPGSMLTCGKTITVACGVGLIDLEIIQPAGSKVMPCCDCAHNYPEGELLGS